LTAKETNQRKAARKFGPDESGLPSLAYFSAAGPKTRFAQTVWPLLPQPNIPLGCVAWNLKTKSMFFQGLLMPGPLGLDYNTSGTLDTFYFHLNL